MSYTLSKCLFVDSLVSEKRGGLAFTEQKPPLNAILSYDAPPVDQVLAGKKNVFYTAVLRCFQILGEHYGIHSISPGTPVDFGAHTYSLGMLMMLDNFDQVSEILKDIMPDTSIRLDLSNRLSTLAPVERNQRFPFIIQQVFEAAGRPLIPGKPFKQAQQGCERHRERRREVQRYQPEKPNRRVEALKKRARRIRWEDPGYLRDLRAHRRAEEETTSESSRSTESAILASPPPGQQDISAKEEGDVLLPLSTPPPLSLSALAMGDPAEMIFPPPVSPPSVSPAPIAPAPISPAPPAPMIFPPPVSPASISPAPPAMGDKDDIIIDVVNPVSPNHPGGASAAAREVAPALEARLDAVLSLQVRVSHSLDDLVGLTVQAVTILHDLHHGQQDIIELLRTMAGAQSLLVMAQAPAGRPPSEQHQ
ncbi:adhesion G protein-coupled receptor B1-like [Rhinatrema bivittatum]|uniref:adhesion G protein-coupled receptor B1-like n=1 Tax=Rhinatrema bivittatum TaxID=194408 RepID=UPI00112DA9C9|nr:adhesion G protein-coupled receptor B1-like [Rhinatrema bivittatum]